MEYRCVATSVDGFVQQLAVAYITHGYWFYVTGTIPEGKDPDAVDTKLIERYGIAISKWARCRRKKRGLANMQYLRLGRFFVLLATKGQHEFFERERASIRDVRRKSIKFAGYSIGCRKGRDGQWHASVRMQRNQVEVLADAAKHIARQTDGVQLRRMLFLSRLTRFAPVRRQVYALEQILKRAGATA